MTHRILSAAKNLGFIDNANIDLLIISYHW